MLTLCCGEIPTAEDTNLQTKKAIVEIQRKAEKDFESYIELNIRDAVRKGKYTTSLIIQEDFNVLPYVKAVLMPKLEKLGYKVELKIPPKDSIGNPTLYIRWE
jgi:hypothetical protein